MLFFFFGKFTENWQQSTCEMAWSDTANGSRNSGNDKR